MLFESALAVLGEFSVIDPIEFAQSSMMSLYSIRYPLRLMVLGCRRTDNVHCLEISTLDTWVYYLKDLDIVG
jgi:hypothetical protein